MKTYNVGIVGATGMVGQRFATLLENHPWFRVKVLAASPRSAGKTYEAAVGSRWAMDVPMPAAMKDMVIRDASKVEDVAKDVDFVFCAVDMPKAEIKALEEAYAKAECPVVSNNSAHRGTPDVPMIIPELNPEHAEIIPFQRKRLGTSAGLFPSNPTVHCKAMFQPSSRFPAGESARRWFVPIRPFPAPERPLPAGRKWWTI